MGIRIDALDAAASATRDHEVPAMKDNLTVKLTVGQILDLLIGAAPGALDTLDELAAALGDDANFAATVTSALAAKAPLASPALTGTPTAPTATPGTNTTQLATTAFVLANAAAITKGFTSSAQTITAGGLLTIPHGLGVVPEFLACELQCVSSELGYTAGDRVDVSPSPINFSTNSNGHSLRKDATNIYVRYGSTTGVYVILNGTTGTITTITPASWRLVVKAFA